MPSSFHEIWTTNRTQYCIRVLIAMLGVVIACWFFDAIHAITPLILGVIASAVAETDDNFSGRLSALLTTLCCFLIATFSIEFLFNTPLFFALGLLASSFIFTMLGALGARYATISFASLLIAVYCMIGASHSENVWTQPLYLLSGAIWYGSISLLWLLFWPMQPVQQSLVVLFDTLAEYLEHKSTMFPNTHNNSEDELRLKDANENAKVVNALNMAKFTLLNHIRGTRLNHTSRQYLKIYFLAQDIHERANSSHCRYDDLASTFFHSDILFRFHHVLRLQANACRDVADSFFLAGNQVLKKDRMQALSDLQISLTYLKQHTKNKDPRLISQLTYLFNNLTTIERQLDNLHDPESNTEIDDTDYFDPYAHTLREKWFCFKSKLSPQSLLFRHAIRLSLTLTLGYGLIQWLNLEKGYWVLLTILFVCQANYSATRSRLNQRVIGTLIGLFCGLPLLTLFPDLNGQLALMVVFGVLFFFFRATQYTLATAFMTLLVVISFNQQGSGFDVMLPRLIDTLIGCLLSVFAVRFILPDWQAHRLRQIMINAISANRDYLSQIIGQYRIGKKDNFAYRAARRDAHNNDAQLSNAITNMLSEPGRYQAAIDESFRFLCLNHSILNYISALGSHRQQINEDAVHALVTQAHRYIHYQLDDLINHLSDEKEKTEKSTQNHFDSVSPQNIEQQLEEWRNDQQRSAWLVLQQLHLIQRVLPELQTLTEQIGHIAFNKQSSKKS